MAHAAALRLPAAHVLGGAEGAVHRGNRAVRRLGQARAQGNGWHRSRVRRDDPTSCRRADSSSPSAHLGAFYRRAFPRPRRMIEGEHQQRGRCCRSRCNERSCRPTALSSSGSGSLAACRPSRARSPYWSPQTLLPAARNNHLTRSERRAPCSLVGMNARPAEQPPGPGHLPEGASCPAKCRPSSLAAPPRGSVYRPGGCSSHMWRLPEMPCIETFHRTSRRKRSQPLCRRRGLEAARHKEEWPTQRRKAGAWKLRPMKTEHNGTGAGSEQPRERSQPVGPIADWPSQT